MSIQITAVRLSGGVSHEHITHLWWTNPSTGADGDSDRAVIVKFIEQDGKAYVQDASGHRADIAVVVPQTGPKYLRTRADGVWTNNLLSLPRR